MKKTNDVYVGQLRCAGFIEVVDRHADGTVSYRGSPSEGMSTTSTDALVSMYPYEDYKEAVSKSQVRIRRQFIMKSATGCDVIDYVLCTCKDLETAQVVIIDLLKANPDGMYHVELV